VCIVSDGAGCMHTSGRKEVIFLKRLTIKKEAVERDALLKTRMVKKCDAKRERWANGRERRIFAHNSLPWCATRPL
jgi:hypothetical protein